MDTTTDHFTPLALRVRGNKVTVSVEKGNVTFSFSSKNLWVSKTPKNYCPKKQKQNAWQNKAKNKKTKRSNLPTSAPTLGRSKDDKEK